MSEEKKYETLDTGDGVYKTMLNKMYLGRQQWKEANPRQILSFMPGMVLEFNVKTGDRVKKGDQLALFKAMKMNNKILAPVDGVVKSINVEKGTNIAKNVLMIELG